jgi:nitronate monooxygenase
VPGLRDSIVEGAAGVSNFRWRPSDGICPRSLPPAAAGHRRAAVHHQQPQAGDRAVQAGIVGSMPSLNARPASQLDEWLAEITETLAAWDRDHPEQPAAPFAINQIVHKTNDRLEHDMEVCAKYKVPIVITSLGARTDINDAVHGWGGVVLHDIINNAFAHKAIEKGADGLIAVAAGAGGHAGVKSPFALVQEIREWFDGPLALSRLHRHRRAVLAARRRWAPTSPTSARPSSPPRRRARSRPTSSASSTATATTSSTPTCSPACTATTSSPRSATPAWTPTTCPRATPARWTSAAARAKKAWKDIWGCGQGIGAVKAVVPAGELVARLAREYDAARQRVCGLTAPPAWLGGWRSATPTCSTAPPA